MSGGAETPAYVGKITIGRNAIDVAALEREVSDPAAGAIVSFTGTTRRDNAGRVVIRLEYEAYEPMALSEMRKLAVEAGARWKITRIAIAHRVGVVEIGETSVAIAVSAPHRAEAFEACRFAIDRLKEIVPIWKKEHFEGGEVWIGCQTSHPTCSHEMVALSTNPLLTERTVTSYKHRMALGETSVVKIILAEPRGFCAGVDRAVEAVRSALRSYGRPLYVRHQIVHNRFVLEALEREGAIFVESLDEVPTGQRVIFSAHGVAPSEWDRAKDRELRVIDATCPLVTKVHLEVKKFDDEGRTVILIGHAATRK